MVAKMRVNGGLVVKEGPRKDELNLTITILGGLSEGVVDETGAKSTLREIISGNIRNNGETPPPTVEVDLNTSKIFETLAFREIIAGALDKQLSEKLMENLVSMAVAQKALGQNIQKERVNSLPKIGEGGSIEVGGSQKLVGRAVVRLIAWGKKGANITIRVDVKYPNDVADIKTMTPVVEIGINVNRVFETLLYRYAIIGAVNALLNTKTQGYLSEVARIQMARIQNGQEGGEEL